MHQSVLLSVVLAHSFSKLFPISESTFSSLLILPGNHEAASHFLPNIFSSAVSFGFGTPGTNPPCCRRSQSSSQTHPAWKSHSLRYVIFLPLLSGQHCVVIATCRQQVTTGGKNGGDTSEDRSGSDVRRGCSSSAEHSDTVCHSVST